ncbi:glucose transporter GlcU [Ligilactobacillus pobuzihii]|uniref:GRP family sugar transporter n=1 Tax=Ligilactobacillus pobuzihii TaxID=449659 RepID=UPI0019CF8B7C|nr:GRP family sugar transporter [Ligilactobacillus pobuzihii]MBN7275350.1 glucose transporter GlcU [Ligilactobacillus pobuzihii]
MGILIGLVPALGWGLQALVMQKIGGKYTNKTLGMALTTIVFGIAAYFYLRPEMTAALLWGSILSGLSWSLGQILQTKSFDLLGVSTAMPVSTGEQLVLTTLLGAIALQEWTHAWQYFVGLPAIAIIVLGVAFTTVEDNKTEKGGSSNLKKGMLILIISSIGQAGYAVLPRVFDLNGGDVLLPQSIAMTAGVMLLSSFEKDNDMFGKKTWQNMLTGICFSVANVGLLFSNQINGVAVGFTLSQLNVVVSTIGGIWFLHEVKTKHEMKYTMWGLALVVLGAVLIGITK